MDEVERLNGLKKDVETGCFFLPFLCEVDVFLRQDGQDLVEHLVRVGLAGQSDVVLRLEAEDRQLSAQLCV